MKLEKSFKIALHIILHSKLRSWLTILGIVIGVASIVSIVSIGSGFEKDVQKQLGTFGSDIITISAGFDRANECPGPHCRQRPGELNILSQVKPLTHKELQAIKLISGISFINPLITGSEAVYYLGKTASLSIEGVDPKAWKFVTTASIDKGRFLTSGDSNAIVIGNAVAHDVFGDEIGVNRQLRIANKSFIIVGVLQKSGGFGFDDRKVFMPMGFAEDILKKQSNTYDAILVKVKDENEITKVENTLTKKLMVVRKVNEDTQDFTVLSMKTVQERVSTVLKGFTFFLGVIAAVSLIVGAVGIANTMFTSVLEKTREIGVMKAVGAKNFDILVIFLLNAGLIGLVGGILGAIGGVSVAVVLPKLAAMFLSGGQTLTTSISISLLIFVVVFSITLGIASGIIPAYRASKLKPIDALRYE